jgi:hypothetical protein
MSRLRTHHRRPGVRVGPRSPAGGLAVAGRGRQRPGPVLAPCCRRPRQGTTWCRRPGRRVAGRSGAGLVRGGGDTLVNQLAELREGEDLRLPLGRPPSCSRRRSGPTCPRWPWRCWPSATRVGGRAAAGGAVAPGSWRCRRSMKPSMRPPRPHRHATELIAPPREAPGRRLSRSLAIWTRTCTQSRSVRSVRAPRRQAPAAKQGPALSQ